MTTQSAEIRRRNEQYKNNITKRGTEDVKLQKKKKEPTKTATTIAPILVGVLLFMIVGGAIFEILMRAPPRK
ncbi:hypothetical protein DFJ73DRAFT_832824 [Zopfochytrium polystomum]|nr:hypothetical protein DFJ73DRAFT_832824 [Zopfochytrium polystomum]